MAIDPGTRAVRFLSQGRRYSSVTKYIARLGHYLHKYVESFHEAKRSLGSDSKTAAITEVSKLLNFCAYVAYSMWIDAQAVYHID